MVSFNNISFNTAEIEKLSSKTPGSITTASNNSNPEAISIFDEEPTSNPISSPATASSNPEPVLPPYNWSRDGVKMM